MSDGSVAASAAWSVSHYLCPTDWSFEQFLDLLAEHGYSGVALTERALTENAMGSIRQRLGDRDLRISSVNSAGFFTGEADQQAWQDKRNSELLEWCVALDGAPLNVIVGGTGAMRPAAARERVLEGLERLVARASELDVPLLLEPLHPLRCHDKSCVNTLAESDVLMQRFPNLGLNIDVFHTWWDPDLSRVLSQYSDRIGVLQLCDVALSGATPLRVPLDQGDLDWRGILADAEAAPFAIPVELELFFDQLKDPEVEPILSGAAKLMSARTAQNSVRLQGDV